MEVQCDIQLVLYRVLEPKMIEYAVALLLLLLLFGAGAVVSMKGWNKICCNVIRERSQMTSSS